MVTKLKTGTSSTAAEEDHADGENKEESSTARYEIIIITHSHLN